MGIGVYSYKGDPSGNAVSSDLDNKSDSHTR